MSKSHSLLFAQGGHELSSPYVPLVLDQAQRRVLRSQIARGLRAVRRYDGYEDEPLLEALYPLDEELRRLGAGAQASLDDVELVLTAQARGPKRAPVSIGLLIDVAAEVFDDKLRRGAIDLPEISVPMVFLPSDAVDPVEVGSGNGMSKPLKEDRLNRVLSFLQRQEILLSDVLLYRGEIQQGAMRSAPYVIVRIPRLNREIAVCDERGQSLYIAKGQKGPLFWATYTKQALRARDDITRVRMSDGWEELLGQALMEDNVFGPKKKISVSVERGKSLLLSHDIVLIAALRRAAKVFEETGKWELPNSQVKEPVEGLAGQDWKTWNMALTQGLRGLPQMRSSLAKLFRSYGLMMGFSENPEVIRKAHETLLETGHHGLKTVDEVQLTFDVILNEALNYAEQEHAKTGRWKLPSKESGEVVG